MKKLLDFGRKMILYIRILSGYEERQLRAVRLERDKRVQLIQQQRQKKSEELILSQVRQVVGQMGDLKKCFEDREATINELLEPLNREFETLINMQLENDKARTKMMHAACKQAVYERAESEAILELNKVKMLQKKLKEAPAPPPEEPQKEHK